MFVIDDAKFPPPTPAIAPRINSVEKPTPGSSRIAVSVVGISSIAAEITVQLRPPKVATAKV